MKLFNFLCCMYYSATLTPMLLHKYIRSKKRKTLNIFRSLILSKHALFNWCWLLTCIWLDSLFPDFKYPHFFLSWLVSITFLVAVASATSGAREVQTNFRAKFLTIIILLYTERLCNWVITIQLLLYRSVTLIWCAAVLRHQPSLLHHLLLFKNFI